MDRFFSRYLAAIKEWSGKYGQHWMLFGAGSLGCCLCGFPLVFLLPGYILFAPLDQALFPNVVWSRKCQIVLSVIVHAVGIFVILFPILLINRLEHKFPNTPLCVTCGRPGKLVDYKVVEKPDPVTRSVCPIHLAEKPAPNPAGDGVHEDFDVPLESTSLTLPWIHGVWWIVINFFVYLGDRNMTVRSSVVILGGSALLLLAWTLDLQWEQVLTLLYR